MSQQDDVDIGLPLSEEPDPPNYQPIEKKNISVPNSDFVVPEWTANPASTQQMIALHQQMDERRVELQEQTSMAQYSQLLPGMNKHCMKLCVHDYHRAMLPAQRQCLSKCFEKYVTLHNFVVREFNDNLRMKYEGYNTGNRNTFMQSSTYR